MMSNMTLNEIIDLQKQFDSNHESTFPWNTPITDNNLENLEFLLVAFAGEFGEVSNIVKKIVRGDFSLNEKKNDISEEIADMFAYLIKMSYQLDIDLESVYLEKIRKNKERFKHYEKNDC